MPFLAKRFATLCPVELLKDYELLQQRKQKLNAPDAIELPEQPSTWDAGYTGVKGDDGKPASAGVLAMLETINEDFAEVLRPAPKSVPPV